MLEHFNLSGKWLLSCVAMAVMSAVLLGQEKVVIIRHGSTPEGDIIRARADAALLLKQAELTGEKAYAQRLDNLIRECDVVYKRFSTRNEMRREALENKYERTFDIIRFNQQLADVRSELERNAIKQRTRIGDPTDEMNRLLEAFARQSLKVSGILVMKTELTPEQLDAIFLTDGSNTFSGKTGKTRLEAFKWPFVIQRKDFQQERDAFEVLCDQAFKEINANNSPSPETITDLLKQVEAIDKKIDSLPLSDSSNVRAVETKWRKESKAFVRELIRTLGNCSKLDSEKLSKYVFQGKTLGELIDHLDSKGLRFSHPNEQDSNLYASIFFVMRYAYQEYQQAAGDGDNERLTRNNPISEPALAGSERNRDEKKTNSQSTRSATSNHKRILQGNWNAVRIWGGAHEAVDPQFWRQPKTLSVNGQTFTLVLNDGTFQGTLAVDTSTSPNQVTFTTSQFKASQTNGIELLGIFHRQGDQLTFCWVISTKGRAKPTRPTDFEPAEGRIKVVFERGR